MRFFYVFGFEIWVYSFAKSVACSVNVEVVAVLISEVGVNELAKSSIVAMA